MKNGIKTLAMWLIIGVIFIVVLTSIVENSESKLQYSELITNINEGNVEAIQINSDGTTATVELKDDRLKKDGATLDKYYKQHEIIFYHGKFGGEKTLRGDIWECKRQKNTVHPTMKPIELITMALQDQPNKKIVYDGFGGSGSTLIACEQLDRKCYMMELDPKYCDVILQRWENLTGKKAELLNG